MNQGDYTRTSTDQRPYSSKRGGAETRAAILNAAVALATLEGLDNLTIGRLAQHVGMSKSGLFAHFGSKEQLQLAVVDEASRQYREEIMPDVLAQPRGLRRLEAMCEAMLSYMERRVVPGICFFAIARAEFCARPGPLQDAILRKVGEAGRFIIALIQEAQAAGEMQGDLDAAQLAFEIEALCDAPNWTLHQGDGNAKIQRARIAIRQRLAQAAMRAPSSDSSVD